MPTSGSSNYTYNRNQIITAALRKIGVVAQGETPTSTQISEASEALNLMVKSFVSFGMPLWKITEYSLTPVADQATYNISTKLSKVVQAFRTDDSIDIPMDVITRDKYNRLSNKAGTSSTPLAIYHDPRVGSSLVTVYPVPDATAAATWTIKLTYAAMLEDFDTSTDDPDFPQEWYEALVYNLAVRLAPEYGVGLDERLLLGREAQQILENARSFDSEEGSLYFSPDWRGW